MFEQLFDNLGTLANAPNVTDAIRVFWQMRSSSPTECSPFVYPDLAFEVGQAMLLKPPERPERCAFVYVGPIIRRDRLWHLRPGPDFTKWCPQCSLPDLPAWVNATAKKIGSLLKEQQVTCAAFYVRLLGLTSTEFLQLVQDGAATAGVPFEASRIKKRPCRLCMEANMEILQRAAASPLLIAEYGSFWPDRLPVNRISNHPVKRLIVFNSSVQQDLPAMHLLARGATACASKMARTPFSRITVVSEVAYLHGDVSVRSYLANMKEVALQVAAHVQQHQNELVGRLEKFDKILIHATTLHSAVWGARTSVCSRVLLPVSMTLGEDGLLYRGRCIDYRSCVRNFTLT
ncbi:unnamed protein product [Symbiodinium sp. CCMP2592]|nr:unnamed protein product [Symbiodinium sp. CCMP2592]